MNESDLENELRKLQPAPPSRGLEEGIARDLAECTLAVEPAQPSRAVVQTSARGPRVSWIALWLDRLLWSGLGATAAVVLVLAQEPRTAPVATHSPTSSREVAPVSGAALQPVLASEEDLGWRDEGVRFDAHGQPMLKLTRTAVERQAWADLRNAGVIQVEKPRQEVLWVPVTLH